MTFTHHSIVKCDNCGERHYPGNSEACIEILMARINELELELEDAEREIKVLRDKEGGK